MRLVLLAPWLCAVAAACATTPPATPAPSAAGTPAPPTPVIAASPTSQTAPISAPISCHGVGDEWCREAVALVAAAYPRETGRASQIIVADTCPPDAVCDRMYAFDSIVVLVPQRGSTDEPLILWVQGKAGPELVKVWRGALPAHIEALVPRS